MKLLRLLAAAGMLLFCLQVPVFAEPVEFQIADVPPEAEAVLLLLSDGGETACVRQGAYWSAQVETLTEEMEISSLAILWGAGYTTHLPRSVLVFSAEEETQVQKLFVPKSLRLATYTVVHKYWMLSGNEKRLEGEISELVGTYTGAAVGIGTAEQRLEYEGMSYRYTGAVPETDQIVETQEGTVLILEYLREEAGSGPEVSSEPLPADPDSSAPPSPQYTPETSAAATPQPPDTALPISTPVPNEESSKEPGRTPRPQPSSSFHSDPDSDPGTGDAGPFAGYWIAAVAAVIGFLLLLILRLRKRKKQPDAEEEPDAEKF